MKKSQKRSRLRIITSNRKQPQSNVKTQRNYNQLMIQMFPFKLEWWRLGANSWELQWEKCSEALDLFRPALHNKSIKHLPIISHTNEPQNSTTTGLHRCELQHESGSWRSGDITPTVGVGIKSSNELRGCKILSTRVYADYACRPINQRWAR